MKKILLFVILLFSLFIVPINVSASSDLDVIREYKIVVDPRDDGTLDMDYYIKWEVLDSTTEGPLTWVKIGIPNSKINELEIELTDGTTPVRSISYLGDGGEYVRLDLKKSYYKGEIVELHFSFHQSYMYTIDEEIVNFDFTPGWFEDAETDLITVLWNSNGVKTCNSSSKEGDYYVWQKANLEKGEKISVQLEYDSIFFPNIVFDNQSTDLANNDNMVIIIVVSVFS